MKILLDEFEIEIRPIDKGKGFLESLHDILALPAVEKAIKIFTTISEGIANREAVNREELDACDAAAQAIVAALEANSDLTFENAAALVADFDLSERQVKAIYESSKMFLDVMKKVEPEAKSETDSV